MLRLPRRLRSLNLETEDLHTDQQDIENLQDVEAEDVQNDHQDEESLLGPPEFDTELPDIRAELKRSIKILWANGAVREVFGSMRTDELWKLNGGRVLVETDEKGIPNQWSESLLSRHLKDLAEDATFAPLHIKRWDDKLFKGPKKSIITDVENKFVYSSETKLQTRDWILKTVNKKWRAYKSKLKREFFHPNKKTLVQMQSKVPDGVNENQWSILLGIWCSEAHKKLCRKNAECGKKLRHPHTTGRKSHPRLKKEMEVSNKGIRASRIDVWDEAHKKKNGEYVNENVQILMNKAYGELATRRLNNGTVSSRDYDDVFQDVIKANLKVNEFYGDENWNQEPNSGVRPKEEENEQRRLEFYESSFKAMCAFIEKKFPGEDWRSTTVTSENTAVSDRAGNRTNRDDHAKSAEFNTNSPTPTNYEEMHDKTSINPKEGYADWFVSNNTDVKEAHDEYYSEAIKQSSKASSTLNREGIHMANQINVLERKKTQEKTRKILLFSTQARNKDRVVAMGYLITKDRTHVVGGSVLGNEYYCVTIHCLTHAVNEKLPRPYENIQTTEDAIGRCVAWPRTHIKRVKYKTKKHVTKVLQDD